ncbi:ATP-binding protein [Roseobacter sp. S98]|uniref:ATP-binding protein n=1 Tax=Roseobacter algicola (ex Choi et al. 2025) (nom. illeg.) TaxID=3092138 RepID=UPI003F517376
MTVVLGRQVFDDLEQQSSARSDNVQWTLTQVEVEYLSFLNTIEHAGHDPDATDAGGLDGIRREFDVFYSRVYTLENASLFANLRTSGRFSEPLATLSAFLDETVPYIDADDATLLRQLDDILENAEALKADVRSLSVSGLSYFAELSDKRRADTARTLTQLAAFSGLLLLALLMAAVYLLLVNSRIRRSSVALRETNHRITTVLETSLDAVIVADMSGTIVAFNPAAETIFGYPEDQAVGQSVGDLIVPPDLREAHEAGMERMQRGGDKHVVGQGRVQLQAMRASGEVFPVELALESAQDGEQEIVISFIRDISRQVADEKELIDARDKALAGQKAKEDFLTVMSHEIRTPLNGMLGNLNLLENTRLSKNQKQFLRNMAISGEVMLNHVNSVLDISRFEAGKLKPAEETLNISELLQDVVDSQSSYAAQNGNVLRWTWVGDAHPWVRADTQRMRQILLNLVGNAIKFTQSGQVTIEAEVTDGTDTPGENVYEFRVIDTGIGIAEENIDAVFEDFHTLDTALNRTSGGTGLGLGIARRMVSSMKGEIGVESEPGEGSVFWIRLPLAAAEPEVQSETREGAVDDKTALQLLVVEDNEINLMVIQKMLEKDGHTVTVARDGRSGVDLAATNTFDAVLMDISMPVMDGLTATHHIREGGGLSAQAPIIAVSANVLPDAVERFRAVGMNAFVSKPIDIASLRKALGVATGAGAPGFGPGEEISRLQELRTDLGDAAFFRLLGTFIKETDALMEQLRTAAWHHDDQTELKMECHRIAGSAPIFDADELRGVLIAIETAIDKAEHDGIAVLVHRARGAWAAARKRLPDPEGA